MKKLLTIISLSAIFGLIFLMIVIKTIDKINPTDYCIENGDCYKGDKIEINKNETIIISKENCLKYHWHWDEKRNMCKVDYRDIR